MVAVIAGNGLGLDNSSLRQLGLGGQATVGQGRVGQYLNIASGNLVLQNADEGMIFGGLPLSALRTYNSQGQLSGNEGWLFGFSRSVGGLTGTLDTAGSTVTRTDDDGSSVVYAYDTTTSRYVSTGQSGPSDTLSWDAGASTWTWIDTAGSSDQRQETYDASGRLTALSDLQTGASYSFNYSNGQLAAITAADGDSLIFGYTGSQLTSLTIQEVPPGGSTPVTRQQVSYHYDSQGRLDVVTTALGSDTDATPASYTTTYTYDGTSDRVASVSQSDGTVVSYTYAAQTDGSWRLATITTGSGAAAQAIALSYDLDGRTTTVTNALGQATTYQYDDAGHLIQVMAPTVNGQTPTTSYQYDTDGNLLRLTDADGGITSYQYDSHGNLLGVEDPTGHTIRYTYNSLGRIVSQTVYVTPAQGVMGQPGYVAPTDGQTTYYVYYDATDGNRLAAVIDPLGHVTGYTYTGLPDGRAVLSSTQHGLVATFDLTGASPDAPPTLAQWQAWVTSASFEASLGQSTRTDYTYDVRGQLATQTEWATVDSTGAGVLDAGTVVSTFVYDVRGQLLQSATERGAGHATPEITSYAYDGLGRLISRTDPLNQATSYVYTDSNGTLAIVQANGLTTTQAYDSAGRLLSSTQSASGQTSRVTTYLYDAAGRQVATIDPAGNASYTFYDADGRVAGTVDATGAVSSITYDTAGHVIGTTQYATAISTAGWISGGALTASFPASLPVPAPSADDHIQRVVMDAAGRVLATIDAEGHVITTRYDGEGRAIATTAFATALTAAQLATLGNAPTWAALQAALHPDAQDRTGYTLYDPDGRVAATVDAAGFVTVIEYDGADRATRTTTYAIALSPAQRSALDSAPTLATLQGDSLTASADDQVVRTYYDGDGRVVAQVDADGYLTAMGYDETTHTTTTARYAMALTASQQAALTGAESVAALVGLLGSTPASQVSTATYDADNQIVSSTAVDGTVTAYHYNATGQLLSTTVTPVSGQGTARTTSMTYDAFGGTLTRTDGTQSTTTYAYNVLGQRIRATDALGNTVWTWYDTEGRVAYTVQGQPTGSTRNALGNVTAFTYNAFGQVASTRTYAAVLTLTGGSSSGTTLNPATATLAQVSAAVAALPVVPDDANALTTYHYTLDGQVASVTDGAGYQTAYVYDAFGDRMQVQQQLSAPGSALSASNSTLSTFTYDARGEQVGEADAVGTEVARSVSTTYDAFGRVTSRTDGDGHVVTFGYDRLGRQVSSSQTIGGVARTTQTTYDAFDRVLTRADALGNLTTYQYDLAQHKTLVTTSDGVTLTTVTNAYGDTVSVTDGAGNATTYTYDAEGRRLTTTDALGHTATDVYDADGELIRTTDATGHAIAYSYDAAGRALSRTVDPDGLALRTTYAYDGEGRQLSVTDPTGTVATYTYDADGRVLTEVQDAGAGKLNLTTTYTYDGAGKTLTVTVGAGTGAARTTRYVYDNLERLSQQIIDPSGLGLTTSYTYDADDRLVAVTDANGHVTRSVYDEAGEKIFTINAAGAVTQATYDADGRVTAVRAYATPLSTAQLAALGNAPTASAVGADIVADAGDTVSYNAYNAEGQVRYRIDPQGYVTETRYDAAGRVSEMLAYAHAISVSAGEATVLQTSQATALSSLASLISGAGNTDANAHATLNLYDADGHVRFVVQQNTVAGQLVGMVSEQRYDAAGRVIARVAYGSTLPLALGSALSAQLSTDSVTQALASAPKQVDQSVYDAAGRLRYRIDNAFQVTETQYDADGRVLKTLAYAHAIVLPGVLTVASLAAAVNTAGTDGAHIGTTTYDATGRVLTTGDALGVNATYTYDATGLSLTQADRDGHLTTTTYDAGGRKILVQSPTVTVGSESSVHLYTEYQYDGIGNVTAISQGAGSTVGTATWTSTTTYAYDAVGHQVTTTYPGGITTQVTYNALGQAVVDKDANGHYQYKAYDADGQVAYAVDADGYVTGTSYDAYGNVTALTRYAAALNTAAIAGWSAGQPLSLAQVQQGLTTSGSDRTLTTTYDQRNQKIEVIQPSISYTLSMGPLAGTWTTGAPTTRYTYDAYGNATSSATLIQGALTVGSTTTPAIWATTYTYYDNLDRAVMTVMPTGQYTAPQGYVTTTSYDAFGQVTGTVQYAQAISTSAITTAAAPALPAAPTAASGGNRSSTFNYDLIGRKVAETDTGTVTYAGGTLGQLDGAPGAATASSVTSYTYDGENRLLSVTVNGATTSTTYDAAGRVASVTAPARLALVADWQSKLQNTPGDDLTSGELYTTVSPVTTYVYDALGHALSTTTSAGGLSQTTQATYDARGNQLTSTDAMGVVTTSTYDNNGNVLTQSYALTANGASSTVTTTYRYDANNQQLSTAVQRAGQSGNDSYTQVKYNAFGEIVAKGDQQGYEAAYTYDNGGNLIDEPDAKTGIVHNLGYDLSGRLRGDGYQGPGGYVWTAYLRDLAGRVISETAPSATAATGESANPVIHSYDRWNNVTSTTDANGNTTTATYDSQNHLIGEVEARVLVVSDSGVRTWATPTKTWYYNIAGQLMGVTDENGHSAWNAYDDAGNLTTAEDAAGALTYTAYDALGRAVAQQTPPVNTATGPVAHITYSAYDARGQVTAQGDFLLNSDGTKRTQQAQQTYTLNSHGDRIRVTDALGNTAYYDYDSQHRVIRSQTPIQHANGWAETFTYDVNGNKIGNTTANGDSQSWDVDYFGRVQSHTDLSGAQTSYAYDANSGLLTSITSHWVPAGQTDPAYLAAGWNGSTGVQVYTYEADGQIAQVSESVDGVARASDIYQYDANGNTVSDITSTSDGAGLQIQDQTDISYDSHNRISVVSTRDSSTGIITSREVINYDAVGNRRAVFVQSAYGPSASPITGTGGAPTGSLAGQTAAPGQAWSFNAADHFVDNIGFGLTFTAKQANGSALPGWMHFNANGTFSGTPTTAGSWSVTVTATDVNGQSVSSTFGVTVPVVDPIFTGGTTNPTGSVHGALSFTVPTATDANGSALTYSATLGSGAALPSWLSFNPSTCTFTGTPPVGSIGSYALKVTATAANGGSASETLTLTIASTPPVYVGGVGDQSIPATRAFSFSYPASDFSEADGDALTFTAGSYSMSGGIESDAALPSWMSFNPATLTFSGTPPLSAENQIFTLYLKATNPQGQAAEAHFTVTVVHYVQPAPVYQGTLTDRTGVIGGSAVNFTLPSGAFTEPDGGALTYSAMVLVPAHEQDYPVNGGTDVGTRTIAAQWVALSTVGLTINATTGAITGVPTTLDYNISTVGAGTFQHDASYQIEIIATNGQAETAAGTFTLSNDFAPPAVQQAPSNLSANPETGAIAVALTGVFSDPYGQGLTYTAALAGGSALPSGLSWSGQNLYVGVVASGSYTITITAKDGLGRTASADFTLTVNNAGPVFTAAPINLTTAAGVAMAAYQAPAATDANGDAITYSASGMPVGMAFNASTRTFSGTPTANGSFTVTYTATDIHGGATHATFTVTVTNAAPVFSAVPPNVSVMSSVAMAAYQLPVATDANGDAITYSASGLPPGLSFNASTRTVSGTPTTMGTYTVTCKATDSRGAATQVSFVITVTAYVQPPPVYHGTLTNRTGVIGGASLNLALPSGAFTESDGGALAYTAMVLIPAHDQDYPVGGGTDVGTRTIAAQWVALSTVGLSINGANGTITGVPTTLDYNISTVGSGTIQHDTSYQIEITATNAQNGSATGSFTLTNSYAPPAAVGTLANHTVNPASGAVVEVAAGTFSDPYNHGLSYQATLSSGAALPSGLTWSGTSFNVGALAAGSYTIKVIATDGLGRTASANFTLTVNNAGPAFSASPTNLSTLASVAMTAYQAPAATDANGDALTYSASNLPPGITFNAATRTFSGTPTALGTWTVTYTVTDGHGATASKTFTITSTNAVPVFSASPANQVVMASVAMAYQAPAATDANGDALTYSASGLPPGLSFNASTRTFSGTPTTLGTYTVTYTATDSHGATASKSFTITVTAYIQPAPVYHGTLTNRTGVIGGASLSLTLPSGAFTESDGGALTYTAMVLIPAHDQDYPVGGGTDVGTRTIAAQWVALSTVGLSINGTNGTITGVPTTLDYNISTVGSGTIQHDSSYQIEITATNAQNASATGSFTLTNSYAPPAAVGTLANHTVNPASGAVVEVAAGTFSDPYNHGLSYQATLSSGAALPSGLTWSGTSFNVGALAAGSYTIKVIATDGLGRTASANFTLTVNNVAPTLAAPSNLTAVQGSAMTAYTAPSATDANGDAITYSASNLPPGISFNAATRAFSGTPTGTGTWTVTYTATDSHGAATSKTFTITVSPPANQPPVYNGGIPSDIFFSPGSLSYTFPATAFTSPAGLALTYTATTPLYIHFDAGTRTFTATQARAERFGTVTLTATDSQGRATSYTFSVDVLGTANNLMAAPDMGSLSSSASSTDEASTSFAPSASPQTVQAQTEATGTTPNTQSYWFTYDADNRVVVSNGALSNGQIVITAGGYNEPSYANQYDAAGNVVVRNTLNADTYSIQAAYVTKTYTAGDVMTQRLVYDARNEQVEVDYATDLTQSESSLGVQQHLYYDADGHQTGTNNFARNDAYVAVYGTHDMPNGYTYVPIGGWLQFGDATSYNADGAVTEQVSFQAPYRDWLQIANAWNNTGNLPGGGADAVPSITGDGPLVVHSTTTYTAFDHAGNVTAYSYAQNPPPSGGGSAFGADYTVSYLKKDGYLEQSTTGTATVQGSIPAPDTSYYDAFGQRTAVSQTSQGTSGAKDDTRLFAYDTRGEILERRRGTVSNDTFTAYSDSTIDHYAYVDGQQIGSLDEGGGIHVLGSLTGFSSGASRQSYVVQAGDTLAGIAQAVYGNSQYGYLVAEANGLGGDSDLVVGQAIALPSITTSSNAANTFKPYDPGQIVGSTTPSLPMVPPPPRVQCQTLSRVIAIVVQVIVSYYSGNPGAGAAAGNLAGQYSSMMFNNQFDWGRAARFAVNPFSGSASDFARTIYDPPAAGAPGKADYKSAAIAGAAAEAGYGAGYLAAPLGNTASLMISAGAQYTTSVELSKMAGYDTSFSWRELGTSMATAYAGAKIADAVGAGPIESRDAKTGATVWKPQPFSWGLLVRQATADVLTQGANYVMRKAAGLSARWDWQDVGADVFGNALGNALVGEIKASRDKQAPDHVNTMWPADIAAPAWHVDDIHVQMPSLGPISYTVQAGDTLSGYAGTSDPATLGMLMYINGMAGPNLQVGQPLISGNLGDYSAKQVAQFAQVGQAALDRGNVAKTASSSNNSAAPSVLEHLPDAPSLMDGSASYGASATSGDPFASYSLATAGMGVDYANANMRGPITSLASPNSGNSSFTLGASDRLGLASLTLDIGVEWGLHTRLADTSLSIIMRRVSGYDSYLLASEANAWKLMPSPTMDLAVGVGDTVPVAGEIAYAAKAATGLKILGTASAIAGPAIEGVSLLTQDKPIDAGDAAHFGVTSGMAWGAWVVGGIPGAVLGATWGLTDLAAQSYHYTPIYGEQAGQDINGWRALNAEENDRWEQKVQSFQKHGMTRSEAENRASLQAVIDIGK